MRKTIGRDLPDGTYVEIEATDHDEDGGRYFAVTVLGWEESGTWSGRACARNGREATFGGAAHETALRAASHLAPLVRVHLADLNGTPMHALANGWYFYSGKARAHEVQIYSPGYVDRLGSDHNRAAEALHIDPLDLPVGMDETQFKAFTETLGLMWLRQAAAARACLEQMVDGDGVEDR